jgi:hypothetical protein
MGPLLFENLFKSEREKLAQTMEHFKFYTISKKEDLSTDSFFNFLEGEGPKAIWFYSMHLNRESALHQLMVFQDFVLFKSKMLPNKNEVFVPLLLVKFMQRFNHLRQFSFCNDNEKARYFVGVRNLRQNSKFSAIMPFFVLWLLFVGVAFFWETNYIESDRFK